MNEEKKATDLRELLIDAGCLVLSYVLLFLLPQKTGILFFLLFGISAFLFCVGFFRLGFVVDIPKTRKADILSAAGFALAGAAGNILGIMRIAAENGSGRSIMIASMLLIQAGLFYGIAGSRAESPRAAWIISLLLRAAAVVCAAAGIIYMIKKDLTDGAVAVCGMLLIEAVYLWVMGSGNNPFNSMMSGIQTVPGMKKRAEELYRDFAEVETQLGKPWLGKIRSVREDCLIYGPSEEDGFYIYGYYNFGRYYVAGSTEPYFADAEAAGAHKAADIPDSSGNTLDHEMLPEIYAAMFTRYLRDGKAVWSTKLPKKKK